MIILGYLLAILIGMSLGMIGGGGSILTVPVLVYLFDFPAKEAIAMSLGVVGIAAIVGAGTHWRQGNVLLRTSILLGIFSMLGAFLGAKYLAPLVSGTVQLVVFAFTMLVAAFFMFRNKQVDENAESQVNMPLLALFGILVGAFTGLVGVGGGFLLVPTLVLLASVPMKKAVGSSLLIISLNSMAGVLGYLGSVPIQWSFLTAFSFLTVVGISLGSQLTRYVSQSALKKGFSIFLILMGLFILYKNRAEFVPQAEKGISSWSQKLSITS